MDAAGALGALGTLIGLVRALPQLIRLLRTRDVHGVSLDTAATSSIVSFGWATYGLLTDQLPVVLATGSSGIVFALIAMVALRFGRSMRELQTAPVWLVVLALAALVARTDGLGVLLPASVLVANVPQLVVAYREADLRGLSLSTWLLSVSDGLVWMTYALVAGDTAILVFGILQPDHERCDRRAPVGVGSQRVPVLGPCRDLRNGHHEARSRDRGNRDADGASCDHRSLGLDERVEAPRVREHKA